MELLPLILLSPLLVALGYCDLRFMRIPNRLVLAMVAIFVLTAPLVSLDALAARLFVAACVFAVCLVAFALNFFGGGDAKALPALMLFVPAGSLTLFGLVFSVSMLFGVALVVSLRMVPAARGSRWVSLRANGTFPMGVSIAMAGLFHPAAAAHLYGF